MSDPGVVVIDREGRRQALSPEQATEAFRSGQHGVDGARVPVRSADGSFGHVDAGELEQFLSANGARLASQEEVTQAEFNNEHQGVGGGLASAAIGAVHGALPFGIGVHALGGLGITPEQQARRVAQHDIAAGTGEFVGAIAPVLLSGGSAGAARGAVAGVEAAELAGGVARGAEAINAARGAEAAVAGVRGAEGVNAVRGAEAAATGTEAALTGERVAGVAEAAVPGAGEAAANPAALMTEAGPVELAANTPAGQAVAAFDAAHAPALAAAAPAEGASIATAIAPDAAALIPARTAAIEAGVAPLGREALAVEEALTTGNRAGFMEGVQQAARFHPYNLASEAGARAGAMLGESGLGRAAGSAVQGAVEGSVYGASNYVNQSMLHDEPLTAEGLAMAVGEGALFGGGANLALHGVGGLVGATRRALPSASLTQSFEQTMNRSAVRALHPTGSAYTRLAERFVPGEAGQAAARGGMRNVDDMGAFLIKEGLFESPRGIMPPSIQEIAQRLETKMTEAGIAVVSPVRAAEQAGVRVAPAQLRTEIRRHAAELRSSPLASVRAQGERLEAEFAMLSDFERPTNFHRMRQDFDAKARFEKGNQAHNATVAMYQDFRRAAQKDLQAAVDAASPELGAAYRVANDRFGKLAWANGAAQKAVGRNLAGSNLPLGSLISGAGAGALFGGVSPQALAVGFLSGALHKWVKENGAALATSGLSAMMKANTLNRVANAVRSNAVRSVRDAFATAARVGVVRAAASRPLSDKQFQETATSLYALSHDPEATLAASQPLQGIQASAPSAGLAAQQVQAARLRYLANLLPGAQAPDPLSALVAIRSATPAQMAQFGKAFAIAKDPSTYLQSFADHTITAETTAHMRALWPATYGTMAQELMTQLESRNEPLSPGMRRTVSVFMGQQPVDQSPAYIMLMQANYGTQPTQGGQPQAASGAPAIDGVAERALTGPQATEARIAAGGPGS